MRYVTTTFSTILERFFKFFFQGKETKTIFSEEGCAPRQENGYLRCTISVRKKKYFFGQKVAQRGICTITVRKTIFRTKVARPGKKTGIRVAQSLVDNYFFGQRLRAPARKEVFAQSPFENYFFGQRLRAPARKQVFAMHNLRSNRR
jgi:hypothetical protein